MTTLSIRPAVRGIAASFVALAVSTSGGCGCSGPTLPEPRIVVDEEDSDVIPVTPSRAGTQVVAKATNVQKPQPAVPVSAPPEPVPMETQARPREFADWTIDDYLTAHEEGGPMVERAARYLVNLPAPRDSSANEERIWLLTRLLEARPRANLDSPAERPDLRPSFDSGGGFAASTSGVAIVVIPFLASCDSEVAWQALSNVLKGTCPTDLPDAAAVEAAIKAIGQNYAAIQADAARARRESGTLELMEALLTEVLTAPASFRPESDRVDANEATVTADRLQQSCLAAVRQAATLQLRARVAEHLVKSDTPPHQRRLLGQWLAQAESINLPAQIVLHNSDLLDVVALAQFRDSFAQQNAWALDRLLGVPPDVPGAPTAFRNVSSARPAGQPAGLFANEGLETEDERMARLLETFWEEQFVAHLLDDLARMPEIGQQRELMRLSMNLPLTAVRARIHQALQRQWHEGVLPFEAAKLTFDNIRDPGQLVAIKLLPREDPKPVGVATNAVVSKEQLARQAWLTASERFVRSLCARFHAAARTNPLREDDAGHKLPLNLPKEARVVAEYHVVWPDDLANRVEASQPSALTLHYVRVQGVDRVSKLSDFYKRQCKSAVVRTYDPKFVWVDSLTRDADLEVARSVDVMITRAAETPPRGSLAPEDLIVEILWIEIPDPAKSSNS